jgi:hypothetical protein
MKSPLKPWNPVKISWNSTKTPLNPVESPFHHHKITIALKSWWNSKANGFSHVFPPFEVTAPLRSPVRPSSASGPERRAAATVPGHQGYSQHGWLALLVISPSFYAIEHGPFSSLVFPKMVVFHSKCYFTRGYSKNGWFFSGQSMKTYGL